MANDIISEIRGNAQIITFNRPEQGNALTLDMANQLFLILKQTTTDKAIRAVLLRGQGGTFMNGLDLNLYARNELMKGVELNNELLLPYNSAIRELHLMDKPVLAAVNGNVFGTGFSFMLASDLVLAGRGAIFNAAFTSYAMTPDGAASFFLPRKVGAAKATELLMLSESFNTETAEKLNLINGVVDDSELESQALLWLDRLAAGPTKAYGGVKRLISKAFEQNINSHMALEHTFWGAASRSFDFREAIKAHFAKRPAKYTGA